MASRALQQIKEKINNLKPDHKKIKNKRIANRPGNPNQTFLV